MKGVTRMVEMQEKKADVRGAVQQAGHAKGQVPWYRSSEAVAERKGRSRAELERSGGRQLRDVRLDKEANEAFQALQAQHPDLDGGAIVRLALVATARKKG